MIRSTNGLRLLSSHIIIRDPCKSIYEGGFHRTLDSGLSTLSSVIRGVGHFGVINPNNRVLSNTSIRGSGSLSKLDYYDHVTKKADDSPKVYYYGDVANDEEFLDHLRYDGDGEESGEVLMERARKTREAKGLSYDQWNEFHEVQQKWCPFIYDSYVRLPKDVTWLRFPKETV